MDEQELNGKRYDDKEGEVLDMKLVFDSKDDEIAHDEDASGAAHGVESEADVVEVVDTLSPAVISRDANVDIESDSVAVLAVGVEPSAAANIDQNVEDWRPKYGEIVWSKIKNFPWWPALMYDPSEANETVLRYQKQGHHLVAFFGDKTFQWLKLDDIRPFAKYFSEYRGQKAPSLFKTAICEALDFLDDDLEDGIIKYKLPSLHSVLQFVKKAALDPAIIPDDIMQSAVYRNEAIKFRDSWSSPFGLQNLEDLLSEATEMDVVEETAKAITTSAKSEKKEPPKKARKGIASEKEPAPKKPRKEKEEKASQSTAKTMKHPKSATKTKKANEFEKREPRNSKKLEEELRREAEKAEEIEAEKLLVEAEEGNRGLLANEDNFEFEEMDHEPESGNKVQNTDAEAMENEGNVDQKHTEEITEPGLTGEEDMEASSAAEKSELDAKNFSEANFSKILKTLRRVAQDPLAIPEDDAEVTSMVSALTNYRENLYSQSEKARQKKKALQKVKQSGKEDEPKEQKVKSQAEKSGPVKRQRAKKSEEGPIVRRKKTVLEFDNFDFTDEENEEPEEQPKAAKKRARRPRAKSGEQKARKSTSESEKIEKSTSEEPKSDLEKSAELDKSRSAEDATTPEEGTERLLQIRFCGFASVPSTVSLKTQFLNFGKIEAVRVNRNSGFGLVTFYREADARVALAALQAGRVLDRKNIERMQVVVPKPLHRPNSSDTDKYQSASKRPKLLPHSGATVSPPSAARSTRKVPSGPADHPQFPPANVELFALGKRPSQPGPSTWRSRLPQDASQHQPAWQEFRLTELAPPASGLFPQMQGQERVSQFVPGPHLGTQQGAPVPQSLPPVPPPPAAPPAQGPDVSGNFLQLLVQVKGIVSNQGLPSQQAPQ